MMLGGGGSGSPQRRHANTIPKSRQWEKYNPGKVNEPFTRLWPTVFGHHEAIGDHSAFCRIDGRCGVQIVGDG